MNLRFLSLLFLVLVPPLFAEEALPGSPLLEPSATPEERSVAMVAGIGKWLHRESERMTAERHQRWAAAARGGGWEKFTMEKRKELAAVLGLENQRAIPSFEKLAHGRVRWTVFEGVYGEGVMFEPPGEPRAVCIVVPDADELPEECALAKQVAQSGCQVIVPVLLSRSDDFSGNEAVRFTNQTHREWIYRQAFEMGRTVIGYEVQKIMAAVDALQKPGTAFYLAGHGEGGRIALHAAALDARFQKVLLSGSFEPHAGYEFEPIDRNLFAAHKDFGDAELAALVAPRQVVVELGAPPKVDGPPPPRDGRRGAAPGVLAAPTRAAVDSEIDAANRYLSEEQSVIMGASAGFPGDLWKGGERVTAGPEPISPEDAKERQRRTVRELERFTQSLIFKAERQRNADVLAKLGGPDWETARAALKERLWASIGKLPGDRLPPNARARRVLDAPKWTAYEVQLDVVPNVFAWGWLLVPKDLKAGERRPVVVCQHGLEGLPGDTVTEDPKDRAYGFYKGFAARLADEGYITYAPHNPYRGEAAFRELQRQANPLGLSLYSFIIAQHEVTTDWLASLPFADAAHIGFYGLSYGGKTAMRVPALVDRYALSICSGDFNEWIRKIVSVDEPFTYMFSKEYEIDEWNLAWNANYAEMAMLIAPRPFMVERGHKDGVGVDEWVAYEFAKVKRGYLRLGVPERTEIEWFDGPHTINGKGTFEFLRKYLGPAKR